LGGLRSPMASSTGYTAKSVAPRNNPIISEPAGRGVRTVSTSILRTGNQTLGGTRHPGNRTLL
jgi:hypothetical protein